MSDKKVYFRLFKDKVFQGFIILFSIVALLPLIFILYYLIDMGIGSLNWDFFFELPNPPGEPGGGVFNAIVGTLMLISVASAIAMPPSIALGIYLAESKNTKFAETIRLCVEVLQGIPSIVIGILAYVWVVVPMGGFSAFSGGVALSIMMIPVVAKSTEETLKLIPTSIKEASLALGAPYYKTILKVVLPSGLSGILSGVLLAIARIAGETAPLLFTAFGNPFMNLSVFKPVNSLPLLIFNYASSPYEDWHAKAWGASFILIAFVLLLNLIAKAVSKKWKVKF